MEISSVGIGYVLVHLGRMNAGPRILQETARVLGADGLLAGIICSKYADNLAEIESCNTRVLKLKTYQSKKTFILSLFCLPFRAHQIKTFLQQFRNVRIMFVMHHLWDPLILKLLKSSTNFKVIYWLHDAKSHPGEIQTLNRILVSSGIKYADTVVTLSKHVKLEIERRANCPPVIQISHPLATDQATFFPRKNDSKQVLFLGRISKYKGLARLRDAWEIISTDFPEANLVIAGDGDIELASELTRNLKNCTGVLKYLSESEIANLMLASAVVVLPYDEASQSGILVKAFEFGIPYVATPVGAIPEQNAELNGGLIADDMQATSFARAVKVILGKSDFENRTYRDELSYKNQISNLHAMLNLQNGR